MFWVALTTAVYALLFLCVFLPREALRCFGSQRNLYCQWGVLYLKLEKGRLLIKPSEIDFDLLQHLKLLILIWSASEESQPLIQSLVFFLPGCQTTSSALDVRLHIGGAGCIFCILKSWSACGRKSRTIVGLSVWLHLRKLTKVYLLAIPGCLGNAASCVCRHIFLKVCVAHLCSYCLFME